MINPRLLWAATTASILAVPIYLSPGASKILNFDWQHGHGLSTALAGKAAPERPVAASQPQLSEYRPAR